MVGMAEMMARYAQAGRVEAIHLRPARREDVLSVDQAEITEDGLTGDHGKAGLRALTLLLAEHLPVVAALAGLPTVDPSLTRRNIVVSGLNLLGFRKKELILGGALVRISGPCPPCSRMEEYLGHGGYTAMRGHGGVYAEVLEGGVIGVGDEVVPGRLHGDQINVRR